MAKGDDAVRRKKNKITRKRMRNSESSVSARVASIIASKRRRKAGKRRICEGMCFSLPTPDDPFNDHNGKKTLPREIPKKPPPPKPNKRGFPPLTGKESQQLGNCEKEKGNNRTTTADVEGEAPLKFGRKGGVGDGNFEEGCLSKFLILCLNAIQNAWKEEEEKGASERSVDEPLLASTWGAELWRRCSAGWNVLETSGVCASRGQLAWLVCTASDVIARKEKRGLVVASPFLLFLVPSQEKAVQVRSVCKPLKALGVHTVSLHPGSSIDHQIHGLKSCEPEFLVSTPERLLELVSLRAIDISGTSLLVLDGLKSFVDFRFIDKVKSIRENICGQPQMVVFSDCYEELSASLVQYLLKGPVYRLSLYDSVASQSAFISQFVHIYTSEEEKISKALQILTQAFDNQKLPRRLKVLLIAGSASKAQMLASKLKAEGYTMPDDSVIDGLQGADGQKAKAVSVKDIESVLRTDIEEFETVMFVEFPSSIEGYVGILTKIARYSVAGAVHSFFCEADASLAQPLIKVLEQCGQTVPDVLRNFDSS